jgi:hypothetical protein
MPREEPSTDKEAPKRRPSEEGWLVIEEYANGLREIIKKFRKHLD